MERAQWNSRGSAKVQHCPTPNSPTGEADKKKALRPFSAPQKNTATTNTASPRFYCWGPPKSPMEMTPNEQSAWNAHLQTPVIFNHHAPIEVTNETITEIDLNPIASTPNAVSNQERVLILTPLRDASPYLEQYFDLLTQLTYPHHLIDLAFLVGDTMDDTTGLLAAELERVQANPNEDIPFRSAAIVKKDFGVHESMGVEDRHSFKAQASRRKALGRARNYLLSAALKPEHSWVYWRDVDIKDSPSKIIEDFIAHDRDVLVPTLLETGEEYTKDSKLMDGFLE
ncbi:MAG: hypothetical protein Q9165_000672 [Trypethelium subeluteriae]